MRPQPHRFATVVALFGFAFGTSALATGQAPAGATVATCAAGVKDVDSCHDNYPTGCSQSQHPAYDASLNLLKNLLPAPDASPSGSLSAADFTHLEQSIPASLTSRNHGQLFSTLKGLGEAKIYTVSAYLYFVQVASGKETSNCQLSGDGRTDFHIGIGFDTSLAQELAAAGSSPGDSLFKRAQQDGIVVEMTPHYREHFHPEWTSGALTSFVGMPVRVTGQLLLDNEHYKPSDDCGHPDADELACWRASSWELHPVIAFDTCETGNCAASSTGWQPIGTTAPPATPALGRSVPRSFDARAVSVASDQSTVILQPSALNGELMHLTASDAAPRTELKDIRPGDLVVAESAATSTGTALKAIAQKTIAVERRSRWGALVVSALLILGLAALLLRGRLGALIVGTDNRYSKSKFQLAVWFFALATSYVATLLLRGFESQWLVVGSVGIPTNLLLLSGLSAVTFVGAKSITQQKVAQAAAQNVVVKQPATHPSFPDDLVNNDDELPKPDLGDFQLVMLTCVAVGTYLVTVFAWWNALPLATTTLPDVDGTILAALGLGHGAYLVKKMIS